MSGTEANAVGDTPEHPDRRHRGYWVIGALFVLSTFMAVFLAWRYRTSEKHLMDATDHFVELGATASVEECLVDVLDWHDGCEAMAGLCDESVSRLMGACLSAQDRQSYCETVDGETADRRFGAQDCRNRDLNRGGRAACGSAYEAIHVHCSQRQEEGTL